MSDRPDDALLDDIAHALNSTGQIKMGPRVVSLLDRAAKCVESLRARNAALEQELSALRVGWREVLQRARDGVNAGSRSVSDMDMQASVAFPLIDHIEEQLAALASVGKP